MTTDDSAHNSEPLASATLAALYVQQGHLDRAGKMVETLLARQPDSSLALALARRIRWLRPTTLEMWTGDTSLHLRLAEPLTRRAILEIRCHPAQGSTSELISLAWHPKDGLRQRVPLPFGSGAAVARLVSRIEDQPRTVATTRVAAW